MNIHLWGLALEVTRKCNEICLHCGRGDAEDLDMSTSIVDSIFDNPEFGISRIDRLSFTGGEPTLNPDLIAYTIDKIIEKKIFVSQIEMITNGTIYSQKIVDALKRFEVYMQQREGNHSKSFVKVGFSDTPFHDEIPEEIFDKYKQSRLEIHKITPGPNTVLRGLGRARSVSKETEEKYKLLPLRVSLDASRDIKVDSGSWIYVNAKAFVTTETMGAYKDMDKINIGNTLGTDLLKLVMNFARKCKKERISVHSSFDCDINGDPLDELARMEREERWKRYISAQMVKRSR